MAKEFTASGSGRKDVDDVQGLMAKLGLREEDLDDVVFEEQEGQAEEITRWLALGKVHTALDFSHFWFFKNMRVAWDLAKDVKTKVIEDNLFVFQFACLGDWEKVMEGGPWVFRAPYDGFTKPSTIKLDTLLVWIQIHDLPVGYKNMVKTLASKVSEFESAEPPSDDYAGNFYRARVRVDVRKQLKRVVSIIRDSKRQLFLVKYERLPDWCAVCGFLGHIYKEHGDGVHSPDALIFKGLKAEYSWRPGQLIDLAVDAVGHQAEEDQGDAVQLPMVAWRVTLMALKRTMKRDMMMLIWKTLIRTGREDPIQRGFERVMRLRLLHRIMLINSSISSNLELIIIFRQVPRQSEIRSGLGL
ncbi:hypothetical protein ACQ4PT_000911 [Festuca glaucescens]